MPPLFFPAVSVLIGRMHRGAIRGVAGTAPGPSVVAKPGGPVNRRLFINVVKPRQSGIYWAQDS